MSLNKDVKLKFHALLAKTSKNSQIYKFTKKRLFYLLTLVRGHLKIVPLIHHFKLGKVKKFQNFIYKDEVITNVFAMAELQKLDIECQKLLNLE